MRDGITSQSGNSRYLKSVENFLSLYPNYEAFANALIAGTLPVDLNGINPTGWQQLGTSLSKANLLSDETESAIFGNAADRTVSQALAGLDRAANKLKLMAKYTVAGAYEWTCPEDGEYIAVIIGGGGRGNKYISTSGNGIAATGGGSGQVSLSRFSALAGYSKNLVVGAGGNADTSGVGGTSSFNGITAEGGAQGTTGNGSNAGAAGGQRSAGGDGLGANTVPCFGGVPTFTRLSDSAATVYYSSNLCAHFVDEKGLPISMMCAGGSVEYVGGQTKDVTLPNGKTLSPGVCSNKPSSDCTLSTVTPTDCGAGSGAIAVMYESGVTVTGTVGNGADGGVFIYKLTGGAAA